MSNRRFVGAVKPADLDAANDAVAAVGGKWCGPYHKLFRVPVILSTDPDAQPARWWLAYARVSQDEKRILRGALLNNPAVPTLQFREIPVGLPARSTIVAWLAESNLRIKPTG